jgi:hypothetical protein
MGRKKPGKPRRPRVPRQYTLHELQPPGEGYEEWFRVTAGIDPDQMNGTARARELFAAALASGVVDERGCEACPAGHLCTRTEH